VPEPHLLFVTFLSKRWGAREELGVGYVASAAAAAGYRVAVVAHDLEANCSSLVARAAADPPLILGLGFSHAATSLEQAGHFLREARRACPSTHITAGGYFATFNADRLLETLPELDSVVRGEGEHTIVELANVLKSGQAVDGIKGLATRGTAFFPRHPIADLDDLSPPVRTIEEMNEVDIFALSTSRGCMAHCTFCNVPAWTRQFSAGWRGRSPSNVVDEIEALAGGRADPRLWVVDSSYEDSTQGGFGRIADIANEILRRRLDVRYYVFMRAESVCDPAFTAVAPDLIASGLRRVFVGVEAGTDEDLKSIAKRARTGDNLEALSTLRAQGLAVRAGWIMFFPHSSLDDLWDKLDQLENFSLLHSTIDLFTCLEIYSGSAEVRKLERRGLLHPTYWHDPDGYDFEDERVAPLARAMREARRREEHLWDGEAIHMADLVLCSAGIDAGCAQSREGLDLVKRADLKLARIKDIQAQANRLFVEELLGAAAAGWDDSLFGALLQAHIDEFHMPTARAARAVASDLVQALAARDIHVRY
jgi:radical SAM superfamily enzyme YgiQ (UPF0313 family)